VTATVRQGDKPVTRRRRTRRPLRVRTIGVWLLAVTAACVAVILITLTLAILAGVMRGPAPAARAAGVPACQQEDGPGPCFWDAGTSGNGQGDSFYLDAAGRFYYTR